jgi:CheY-like chemotaxis protein
MVGDRGGPGGEGLPVNNVVRPEDARERAGVQDEAPVASLHQAGLEAEGFAVRTACDGAEGLELLSSLDFDLIVLDLPLPTVTGEEILSSALRVRPCR